MLQRPMYSTVADFAGSVRSWTAEDFQRRYPGPFLLVQPHEAQATDGFSTLRPDDTAQRPPSAGRLPLGAHLADELVVPLVKSRRNAFRNLVTVGRSVNNDVILAHPAVSKLHAFFRLPQDDEAWTLTDPGSSNGTWLGPMPLERNRPVPLRSGQVIGLAGSLYARFLSPASLHEHIESLRALDRL